MSEGTLISPQGTEFPNVASLYSEEHVEGWKKVIDGVHNEGGTIVLQPLYTGRIIHNNIPLQKKFGKPVSGKKKEKNKRENFSFITSFRFIFSFEGDLY